VWTGLNLVLKRCAKTVQSWTLIQSPADGAKLEEVARALEERSTRAPLITWERTSESLVFFLENAGELRFIRLRRKSGQEPVTTEHKLTALYGLYSRL
jgi:hypothetical protein